MLRPLHDNNWFFRKRGMVKRKKRRQSPSPRPPLQAWAVGKILDEGFSYVSREELEEFLKTRKSGRIFTRFSKPLTYVNGRQIVKTIEAWSIGKEEITLMLEEAARVGVFGASMPGNILYRKFQAQYPRCQSGTNNMFMKYRIGPWDRFYGNGPTEWAKGEQWDIVSAYASNAMSGLPHDTETCVPLEEAEFKCGKFHLPKRKRYPNYLQPNVDVVEDSQEGILSIEEEKAYGARWLRVDNTFGRSRTVPMKHMFDWAMRNFTKWKYILRAYWSVMHSGSEIDQYVIKDGKPVKAKGECIPRATLNMPASHLIYSRTDIKLFPHVQQPGIVRIWADCFDGKDLKPPSPIGPKFGEWMSKKPFSKVLEKAKMAGLEVDDGHRPEGGAQGGAQAPGNPDRSSALVGGPGQAAQGIA